MCERGGAVEAMEVRATSLPTLVQMVAGGLGLTLLPETAAAALVPSGGTLAVGSARSSRTRTARSSPSARVQPKGPVALAQFANPPPGRTIGLAWRTSSARLREFRLLADTLAKAADTFLAKLRR